MKMGIFRRDVRVSRSELTKKRVVGVERVGERRKRNGIDGYPIQGFSFLVPAVNFQKDAHGSTGKCDFADSETG